MGVAVQIEGFATDSIFNALDTIRADVETEEQWILQKSWLWDRAKNHLLDRRLTGLRAVLRRSRWAFLPPDEATELRSGPFLSAYDADPGLAFRLVDLERESGRAHETVQDILAQLQDVVTLRDGIKNDRLADTTYALTAVATVLLVPTLLAGIYGMNFLQLPGSSVRSGFWLTLAVMVLLGGGVWLAIRAVLRSRARDRSDMRDAGSVGRFDD